MNFKPEHKSIFLTNHIAIFCSCIKMRQHAHRQVPWGCVGSSSWTSGWVAWGSAPRSEGTWSWWWRRGRRKREWRWATLSEPAGWSEPADPWGTARQWRCWVKHTDTNFVCLSLLNQFYWSTSSGKTTITSNIIDLLEIFFSFVLVHLPLTIFSCSSSWMMLTMFDTLTLLMRPLMDFFRASQLILW